MHITEVVFAYLAYTSAIWCRSHMWACSFDSANGRPSSFIFLLLELFFKKKKNKFLISYLSIRSLISYCHWWSISLDNVFFLTPRHSTTVGESHVKESETKECKRWSYALDSDTRGTLTTTYGMNIWKYTRDTWFEGCSLDRRANRLQKS